MSWGLVGAAAVSTVGGIAGQALFGEDGGGGGGGGQPYQLSRAQLSPIFRGPQVAEALLSFVFNEPDADRELFPGGPTIGDLTDAGTRNALREFIREPLPFEPSEREARRRVNTQLFPALDRGVERLESIVPFGEELAETGFRTDLQPIIDAETRRLFRETIPAIAERLPTVVGESLRGSGATSQVAQAAEDLGFNLGALQVEADEAAALRRLQGLSGPVQAILSGPSTFEIEGTEAIRQIGSNIRRELEQTRPGARILQGLAGLTNIESQQEFLAPSFPTPAPASGGVGGLFSQLGPTLGLAAQPFLNNLFFSQPSVSGGGVTVAGGPNPPSGIGGSPLFQIDSVSSGPATSSGIIFGG